MNTLRQRLATHGLFSLDPEEQGSIARKCEVAGLLPEDIDAIVSEARRSVPPRAVLSSVAGILRKDPAQIREIALQLRDRQKTEEKGEKLSVKNTASSFKNVSNSNPYGWSHPDAVRGQDYGEPGAWNPYRQSYNYTDQEMLEGRLTDARRYGCSRWEALGNKEHASSKYDHDMVEKRRQDLERAP